MFKSSCVIVAIAFAVCDAGLTTSLTDNDILVQTPRLVSGDELLNSVISDCFESDSTTRCLKEKVLGYLDTQLGVRSESSRALQNTNIDKVIYDRASRILSSNEFRLQLPQFLFQGAELSYRANRGFDVDFPVEENEVEAARGVLKKKLLLPVLLLLKLKMKALMPILVGLIGIKAFKALILSKLAITLVLGFLIYNLVMKKGAMPMMMMPAEPPAPQYGAPPSNAYGTPGSTPAAPTDSYSPQWEPNSSGPYARVWDPSVSSSLAYSSYYPAGSSGSSASSASNVYPSISSSSVVSSNAASY